MFHKILRAINYIFGPEQAQAVVLQVLHSIGYIPAGRWLLHKIYAVEHPSLEREVFGMRFKNPIGLAAGYDRNAFAFRELSALGFGFVEVGTITPRPQMGNPRPRIFRLDRDRAIFHRTGMANRGLERAIDRLRRPHEGTIVGCNIGCNAITPAESQAADYLRVFRNLYQYADYFTVNISCNPTLKSHTCGAVERINEILAPMIEFRRGQNQYRPILLKISPDLTDSEVDAVTDIMLSSPLDGIVATDSTASREGVTSLPEALRRSSTGTISGAPLTQRAIEIVARIYERSKGAYPIIGVGGLMTPADVQAMLNAGATLVQLYTGFVYEGMKLIRESCRALIREEENRQ